MRPVPAGTTLDEAYHELCAYALTRPDAGFVHQNIVDAYTAQQASRDTKPIAIVFALVGLYLALEKGFSGKQVQRAHLKLARHRRRWPSIPLPATRGALSPRDVLLEPPGPARDRAIQAWCLSVWQNYQFTREMIAALLREYEISD